MPNHALFSSIRVVLVATTHPGNIGSAARALKTMGFDKLYLVTPKSFPDLKAFEMSAGAEDVLNSCVVTSSLQEALNGCQLVLGTSARPRGLDLPGLTPKTCAELVAKQPDNTEIALVFGREHAGLTNDELLQCQYHINIPSNPDYSSLNLAQAVQIIVYEIRMALLNPKAQVTFHQEALATREEVEQFYQHLTAVLTDIHFIKPHNPKRIQQRLRRLFNRAMLEKMEVAILRGILSHIKKAIPQVRELKDE